MPPTTTILRGDVALQEDRILPRCRGDVRDTQGVAHHGGSRGNPGPAGIGIVIRAADNTPLLTIGRYIRNAQVDHQGL